jgi:hypothetical protein
MNAAPLARTPSHCGYDGMGVLMDFSSVPWLALMAVPFETGFDTNGGWE